MAMALAMALVRVVRVDAAAGGDVCAGMQTNAAAVTATASASASACIIAITIVVVAVANGFSNGTPVITDTSEQARVFREEHLVASDGMGWDANMTT
jgi:hypothetical protein